MIDVLILGNGFDLAHELPTSYKNFLSFCKNAYLAPTQEEDNLYKKCCETNLWMKHFLTRQSELGDTWIDLEEEILESIKHILRCPAASGGGFLVELCPKYIVIPRNNIDFKFNQLKNYLEKPNERYDVDDKEYTVNTLRINHNNVYVYIKTIEGFSHFLYDQLREFTELFAKYLTEEVIENIDNKTLYRLSLPSMRTSLENFNIYILSFNYTDTFEKIYKEQLNRLNITSITPIYVHGKITTHHKCNLVLGTRSFDNKKSTTPQDIPIRFKKFQKHNQRHKYGTIEDYQNLLKSHGATEIKPDKSQTI